MNAHWEDWLNRRDRDRDRGREALLYGGIALGLLAGVALSTYIWRQRVSALDDSPLERADDLINATEAKLDEMEKRMEKLMNDWQAKQDS